MYAVIHATDPKATLHWWLFPTNSTVLFRLLVSDQLPSTETIGIDTKNCYFRKLSCDSRHFHSDWSQVEWGVEKTSDNP